MALEKQETGMVLTTLGESSASDRNTSNAKVRHRDSKMECTHNVHMQQVLLQT